jgi:hypothetical protein
MTLTPAMSKRPEAPALAIAMDERKASHATPAKAVAASLDFWYGANQALKNIDLTIP